MLCACPVCGVNASVYVRSSDGLVCRDCVGASK